MFFFSKIVSLDKMSHEKKLLKEYNKKFIIKLIMNIIIFFFICFKYCLLGKNISWKKLLKETIF